MPSLVDLYDGFLFDLEGLLEPDTGLIPYAAETLDALGSVVFMTNNATRTPVEVATLLAEHGVHAHRGQVVTTSQAAARLVTGLVPARSDEFVLGTQPPDRAGDEPSYPALLRAATRLVGSHYTLAVTHSLDCVVAARLIGIPSALLLTRATNLPHLLRASPAQRPTFIATNPRDLLRQQPIVDCTGRYWECEGWAATVSHDELHLFPGPRNALGAGVRVMCAATWNWQGSPPGISAALTQFNRMRRGRS